MFEIGLGRFDQIWDEVVATLKLDIYLGKRVFEGVAQANKLVVCANGVINGVGYHANDDEDDDR